MTMEVRVGVHKPEATAEPEGSAYGSCEEAGVRGGAESAGKPGRRSGFPEGDGSERAGRGRGWSGSASSDLQAGIPPIRGLTAYNKCGYLVTKYPSGEGNEAGEV